MRNPEFASPLEVIRRTVEGKKALIAGVEMVGLVKLGFVFGPVVIPSVIGLFIESRRQMGKGKEKLGPKTI